MLEPRLRQTRPPHAATRYAPRCTPSLVHGRGKLTVPSGPQVSFAHVLQRLPGQLLAALDACATVSGCACSSTVPATVIVYRSSAERHTSSRVTSIGTDERRRPLEFELPLKPFGDGGWYWFDLVAGGDESS